jgi:hypothetical protein
MANMLCFLILLFLDIERKIVTVQVGLQLKLSKRDRVGKDIPPVKLKQMQQAGRDSL